MKKVLLRGPILSRSGYGEHARQVYSYLETKKDIELKVQLLPWGITPWYLNHQDLDGLVGRILEKSTDKIDGYDVSLQVQLPNEWDTSLAAYNVGITAAIETTFANPGWVLPHSEKMDMVITPSQHAKNSLTNSGTTSTPIHVIPECFFKEIDDNPESLSLDLDSSFNFLTVGVLTGMSPGSDRKNLFFLIKWFVEEFRNTPDVGLVIKTNRGRETTIDRRATSMLLEKILNEIGHTGSPKVYLLHGQMSRTEMTSLYKDDSIKAFLSCTRGEGFGLPHLESAAAGLPVIATNWSSHKEFLDKGKWVKLEYDLIDIDPEKIDNNIFLKGMQWADVKEDSFKKSIRKFYEKPHMPQTWANDLKKKILKEYNIDSIIKVYDEHLGAILK
jgi:glycosyltransferase involved in cell wall biosynthesis